MSKFLAVESIRGVACLMVVFSHISYTFFPYLHAFNGKADPDINGIQYFIHESPFAFFFSGSAAVYMFFVLSGFILTKVALSHSSSPQKIFSMSIKRYPRLMIPALTSCLIAFVFFLIFDITSPNLSEWINEYGAGEYSFFGAMYSGLIDVFFVSGQSTYNPVLWTMKIELIGSFVIYIICLNHLVFKIKYFPVMILFLIISLISLGWIENSLGLGLLSFYGGYAFSTYGKKIPGVVALPVLALGIYLAGAHNDSWSYSFLSPLLGQKTYIACNFFSGFIIVYAILFNSNLIKLFSGRLTVFMGKVSFSVYLIHMPILSTLGVYLFEVVYSYSGMYGLSAISSSIFTVLFIYLVSTVFYSQVDVRGMLISKYLSDIVTKKIKSNGHSSA